MKQNHTMEKCYNHLGLTQKIANEEEKKRFFTNNDFSIQIFVAVTAQHIN